MTEGHQRKTQFEPALGIATQQPVLFEGRRQAMDGGSGQTGSSLELGQCDR